MHEMTDDERYAAIRARDARFDGMFFTCVHSTGIFCRPSCPSRTPTRANTSFVPSAAAAVDAGFRACKRCGPAAPPGSPAEDPAADLARRALRLIRAGALDDGSVPELASRLAVSERTLHRALLASTGAGAVAHARMSRARRAHELVRETSLPLSTVAFAAGFGSERQLHDTFTRIFGHAPSVVRERAAAAAKRQSAAVRRTRVSGTSAAGADPGAGPSATTTATTTADDSGTALLQARLAVRRPFDGDGLARWFAARAVPGVDAVEDGVWARSVRLPHGPGIVEVDLHLPATADGPSVPTETTTTTTTKPAPSATAFLPLTLRLADIRDVGPAIALVRGMLDLDADPIGIDAALTHALPALAPLIAERPGVRLPGLPDLGEALLWAIVGQQIATPQARDQIARATDLAGEALPPALATGSITRLLPTGEAAAATAEQWYRGPAARRRALITALTAPPDADALDPGSLREAVLALPGVGPWTAGYALLRGTRATDVAPPRDVALLAAARDLGLAETLGELPDALAPAAPWRSYASLHLWHHAASLPPAHRRPGRTTKP